MMISSCFGSFKFFCVEICVIFLSIATLIFGYPLLLIFLFPIWIYKRIVKFFVQRDPKVGRMLEGIDGAMAGKDPHSNPLVVLAPYYTFADKLEIQQVVSHFMEKIIKPGYYPEFTQKIVSRYGYHFWYSVDNFKIEDHVKYLKPECPNMPLTRVEFRDLVTNKLGKVPFDPNRSPWEILLVPNYMDDRDPEAKSVLVFKVNHCMADGYSSLNVIQKLASKPWKYIKEETMHKTKNAKSNRNCWDVLKTSLLMLLTGPYHVLKMCCFSDDKHDFVRKVCGPDFKETWNSQITGKVPVTRLKEVKNLHAVSMTALITTLIAQASYMSMQRAAGSTVRVRSRIHAFQSFPLPGHPDSMTNHWSFIRIPIQVDENDPRKTLKFVEREFQKLKNSVKPLMSMYISKLISTLPMFMRYIPEYITPSTILLTNLPGPTEPSDAFGCRVIHLGLGGKTSRGTAFLVSCFSVNDSFWFDVGGPICNIPTQEDADFIIDSVMATLTTLEAQPKAI